MRQPAVGPHQVERAFAYNLKGDVDTVVGPGVAGLRRCDHNQESAAFLLFSLLFESLGTHLGACPS
jgi:hypothetical protein